MLATSGRIRRARLLHRQLDLVEDAWIPRVEGYPQLEDAARVRTEAPIPEVNPEEVDVAGRQLVPGMRWLSAGLAAPAPPTAWDQSRYPVADRRARNSGEPCDLARIEPTVAQFEASGDLVGGARHEHMFAQAPDANLTTLENYAAVAKFGKRAAFRSPWGKPLGGSSPLSRIDGQRPSGACREQPPFVGETLESPSAPVLER